MKVLTIGLNNVRRLMRERSNVFFVFVFPMLLILVLGATFGGGFVPRLGVVATEGVLADGLVTDLQATDGIEVEIVEDRDEMVGKVQTGRLDAALVMPADYDAAVTGGAVASVEFVLGTTQVSQQLFVTVQAAITRQSIDILAARLVANAGDASFSDALARTMATEIEGVDAELTGTGESVIGDAGQFDLGAPQQLALFIFLTSLAGSASLIQTRRWGVARRMLSTPTSGRSLLVGEALGRFGIAMVQGVFIMVGSLVAFGVNWGEPLAASALLVVFAATGAGAAMLLGSILDNDEQGASVGVFAGLGLAAFGGAMVPIEFFPETIKTLAHITPHAWLLDGFAELIRRDGGLRDIALELGVLALYAAVLLAVGSFALRKKLTA